MMIEQLEECSGKINTYCKAIIDIYNDPIKLITKVDDLNVLLNGISLELAVFNNFTEAINKKEGEENEH